VGKRHPHQHRRQPRAKTISDGEVEAHHSTWWDRRGWWCGRRPEGPLPGKTKFVVFLFGKPLRMGLRQIVVINKGDSSDAPPQSKVIQRSVPPRPPMFAALDATDEQLRYDRFTDFQISRIRASRAGWLRRSRVFARRRHDAAVRFCWLSHVKPPWWWKDGPFRLLGTILEAHPLSPAASSLAQSARSVKPNKGGQGVLDSRRPADRAGRIPQVLAFRGPSKHGRG